MKKLIGITLALLVLASCQVPFGGPGAIRISLANADGKDLGKAALNTGDPVRIQLLRNSKIIPLDGQEYKEVKFASQTLTLDQLAPGTGYKVLVAGGKAITSNGNSYFEVTNFGESATFEVTAGVESAVAVAAPVTPVKLLAGTAGSKGAAAVVGGTLYALAGTVIQTSTDALTLTSTGATLGTGYSVNSFTTGLDSSNNQQLWVNTSRGISILSGNSLPSPQIKGKDDKGNVTVSYDNVLFSGSVRVLNDIKTTTNPSPDGKAYYLHLFGGEGISAGARFEKDSTPDDIWYSVNDKLGTLPSSVTDVLNKSGNIFLGYAKADSFAYVATSLGIYRISKAMVTEGQNKSLQFFDPAFPLSDPLDETQHKVTIGVADGSAKTRSVAYGVTVDKTNSRIFVGTNKGLYTATVDTSNGRLSSGQDTSYDVTYTEVDKDGNAVPDPNDPAKHKRVTLAGQTDKLATLVGGTEGKSFSKVISVASDPVLYTAAYAENTREILFFKDTSLVKTIPLFAGLPSGRLDLVWFVKGSAVRLVASGDNGTVTIDPTKL